MNFGKRIRRGCASSLQRSYRARAGVARNLAVWALAAWVLCQTTYANDESALIRPNPSLTPEQVVAIQLDALKRNDQPHLDAGIAQNWLFAHPLNKRETGPYSRFAAMLRSPAFGAMLDHQDHRIEIAHENPQAVTFMVLVKTLSGDALGYRWTVEKVREGRRAACWMTTRVSPPVMLGEFI